MEKFSWWALGLSVLALLVVTSYQPIELGLQLSYAAGLIGLYGLALIYRFSPVSKGR